jgi:hypothetical protein
MLRPIVLVMMYREETVAMYLHAVSFISNYIDEENL